MAKNLSQLGNKLSTIRNFLEKRKYIYDNIYEPLLEKQFKFTKAKQANMRWEGRYSHSVYRLRV